MQKEINQNIILVKNNIAVASRKANIDPRMVSLIAVSKKKDHEYIRAAIELGLNDFGENYAQELASKAELLQNEDINWHFIGPIQTNKIKLITTHASWIHSLDRPKVVDKLNNECIASNKKMNALIQINISGEETKSGISPNTLLEFASYVNLQSNIVLKGIMVLPKMTNNIIDKEREMIKARKLHNNLVKEFPEATYLSMGTTSDFECAIKCGSNMIRVGELIFGKRK